MVDVKCGWWLCLNDRVGAYGFVANRLPTSSRSSRLGRHNSPNRGERSTCSDPLYNSHVLCLERDNTTNYNYTSITNASIQSMPSTWNVSILSRARTRRSGLGRHCKQFFEKSGYDIVLDVFAGCSTTRHLGSDSVRDGRICVGHKSHLSGESALKSKFGSTIRTSASLLVIF
jgi:hypothetical protein